jgi:hypothetical protein
MLFSRALRSLVRNGVITKETSINKDVNSKMSRREKKKTPKGSPDMMTIDLVRQVEAIGVLETIRDSGDQLAPEEAEHLDMEDHMIVGAIQEEQMIITEETEEDLKDMEETIVGLQTIVTMAKDETVYKI